MVELNHGIGILGMNGMVFQTVEPFQMTSRGKGLITLALQQHNGLNVGRLVQFRADLIDDSFKFATHFNRQCIVRGGRIGE